MYFGQQSYASGCVCMVEDDRKRFKIITNFHHAHKWLTNKYDQFLQNCWGATSFWMSTRVWESLLNAKNVNFCSYSYVSLTSVSRMHDEKSMFLIILKRFLLFGNITLNGTLPTLSLHSQYSWQQGNTSTYYIDPQTNIITVLPDRNT